MPPTVSITSPAQGASLSGTVTVTANAADNVAVAGNLRDAHVPQVADALVQLAEREHARVHYG